MGDYYELYKSGEDPIVLRKQIVDYAKIHGVSAAAEFNTTWNTVPKWVNRYDENGIGGYRLKGTYTLGSQENPVELDFKWGNFLNAKFDRDDIFTLFIWVRLENHLKNSVFL